MNTDSNAYFSVLHPFDAYLSRWPSDQPLPSDEQLHGMKSKGMQLISEVKALEGSYMMQLRHLGDDARTIADYMKLQSRKIDLVLQHLLEQELKEGVQCQGLQFGGSNFRVNSNEPFQPGEQVKATLFIREEVLSILCFASVLDCHADPQQPGHYIVELAYSVINDTEVEHLVKASLNIQQKQLQLRKANR
ncbi:hypothetical protein HR45_18920 [Shewanella mangrovi]|uniref:PilZ domain-containing protein n=1 Tax=Shewanella mangrovi TaxID=1515746 RepID=A0A094JU36_9GAMM|nr:hypothetical protein [Shewanella mangrovi]KFZ35986.1 hypothetical protein HR45_18920 [Shewanella mangrovi]